MPPPPPSPLPALLILRPNSVSLTNDDPQKCFDLKAPLSQQHLGATNLLPIQWQHPLSLQTNQQMQSESQLSQQFLQQYDTIPFNMHQGLEASAQAALGPLWQPHNEIYQQKQLCQSPGVVLGTSSKSLSLTAVAGQANGFGGQEDVNQRIKVLEMTYLHRINEMRQMVAAMSQQVDSPLQQFNPDWLQNTHNFKDVLGQMPASSQNPQDNGLPREKLDISEETANIIYVHRKYVLPQQQRQGKHHLQSMQQQSQLHQVHSPKYQWNPRRPATNFQGFEPTVQLVNSEGSGSSSSRVFSLKQNLTHPLLHGSNFDPRQGNSIGSLQQLALGLQYPYTRNFPQQLNNNRFSSPSGINISCPYDPASQFQGISTLPSERAAGTAATANTIAQLRVSRALLAAGTKAAADNATTTPVAAIKPLSKAAASYQDADTTNALAISDRYANGLKII